MQFELNEYVKVGKIICGLDDNAIRYRRFLIKYCEDLLGLYVDPKFMQLISSKAKSKKERDEIKNIRMISFDVAKTGDILFNCNLKKFLKYLKKYEGEFKEFFNDSYIGRVADVSMDMCWIADCSTITIDTFMDMFFKFILNEKNLPRGFNNDPIDQLEKVLNIELNDLYEEFKLYKEMHSKRNLFAHNNGDVDSIAEKELEIKTSEEYTKLISSLGDIVKYTKVCVIIVIVIMKKLIGEEKTIELFENNEIFKHLNFNEEEKTENEY